MIRFAHTPIFAAVAGALLGAAANAASPVQYRPIVVEALPPAYLPATPPAPSQASRFQAAPVPNRDAELPTERASNDPKLSATLYNRRDQFRGDAIAPSSSAQIDQERRVRPGAGLALKIPQ